ncbi:MAG: hypothetical protein IJ731_09435 [Eubacterium sp.]|nr:hypothetical protein [Eubacterium sp.]
MRIPIKEIKQVANKAKISYSAANKRMMAARKEYGISYALYAKLELYKLSDEEFEKRAKSISERRKRIEIIMQKKGFSYDEAVKYADYLKNEHNLSLAQYVSNELYNLSDFDLAVYAEKKREGKAPQGRKKWALRVADKTGWTFEEANKRLERAKTAFGISAGSYYKHNMFAMSETEMATVALRLKRKQARRDEVYEKIFEICSKTKEDVRAELDIIRKKQPFFTIGVNWYFDNGIYELDLEKDNFEIDRRIQTTIWLWQLASRIREKLVAIEEGKLSYGAAEPEIEEYYQTVDSVLSNGKRDMLVENIKYLIPEVETDEKLKHDIALDMRVTELLLKFTPDEYVSFHFWGKSIMEKQSYVSSVMRAKVIQTLNPQHIKDMFNNKFSAYSALKEYYGRDIVLIDGENAKETFCDFCKKHSTFVKKNNYDALGRGVEKVEITPETDLDALYEELTEGGKLIILEELINANDEIKKLNRDSVNTVRIITYVKNYSAEVLSCFMKVGRAGSFIDNGGAGGILVHINKETGTLDSNGIDERGIIFENHPDNGYKFSGIQLPEWDKALKKAKEIALEIKDARFIGWDFTYTSDGEWIVVEGNALTQFFAQQATIGKGIKREFLEQIGYDELKLIHESKLEADSEDEEDEYAFERRNEKEFFLMEDKATYEMKRHYLEERGFAEMKYFPNLSNPQTINEKILWLALNYKHPDIARAADKTTAKDYIAERVGREHTVPTYGVYENASDIDFDSLPRSFVIKLNDGWGASSVKIINDKEAENLDTLRAELTSWLYPWNNYYYRNMCVTDEKLEKPALIVEKLLKNKENASLNDYKIYCCNGEPKYALVVSDRLTDKESRTFVDKDWNVLPTGRRGKRFSNNPPKPENLEKMFELSRLLSKEFPFVRIDFYENEGRVYIGELTFTPGMFMRFTTLEWDKKLGDYLDLSSLTE